MTDNHRTVVLNDRHSSNSCFIGQAIIEELLNTRDY